MIYLYTILECIIIILPVLLSVAYMTLLERKVLAAVQLRQGPNVVGLFGLLQPWADACKLFIKETIIPSHANKVLFVGSPILALFLAIISYAVVPFGTGLVLADIPLAILYLFVVSSLGVYSVLFAGWASNSKYPLLGAIRSTAQLISYDVALGLIIINVILITNSLNLTSIVVAQTDIWYIFPLWPAFIMFFASSLAETARPPFDLLECESELVAGHMSELSAMTFANYFLSEYAHVLLLSLTTVFLFLGGWLIPSILDFAPFNWIPESIWLSIKVALILYLIILIRASYPRFRYDQLMSLLWKGFLPLSIGFVIFTASILYIFGR